MGDVGLLERRRGDLRGGVKTARASQPLGRLVGLSGGWDVPGEQRGAEGHRRNCRHTPRAGAVDKRAGAHHGLSSIRVSGRCDSPRAGVSHSVRHHPGARRCIRRPSRSPSTRERTGACPRQERTRPVGKSPGDGDPPAANRGRDRPGGGAAAGVHAGHARRRGPHGHRRHHHQPRRHRDRRHGPPARRRQRAQSGADDPALPRVGRIAHRRPRGLHRRARPRLRGAQLRPARPRRLRRAGPRRGSRARGP
jgi:hypothetical protein